MAGLNDKVELKNVERVREAIRVLSEIPVLQPHVDGLGKSPIMRLGDGAIIESSELNAFNAVAKTVYPIGQALIGMLGQMVTPLNPDAVYIKLPPVRQIGDFVEFIKDMVLIFDTPARTLFKAGVSFGGFDTGSDWLVFVPDAVEAVKGAAPALAGTAVVVAGAVKAAARPNVVRDFIFGILSAYQHVRLEMLRYRAMLIQVDSFAATQDVAKSLGMQQKEIAEQITKLAVKQLVDAQAPTADESTINDAINKGLRAMEHLDKWVRRGAEFSPALNAPPEVQKLLDAPVTAIDPAPPKLPAHEPAGVSEAPKDSPKE